MLDQRADAQTLYMESPVQSLALKHFPNILALHQNLQHRAKSSFGTLFISVPPIKLFKINQYLGLVR